MDNPPPLDTADPRPDQARTITLRLNPVQAGVIWDLYATGLFGADAEQVVSRLLDEGLRRARAEGWFLPE